MDRLGTGIWVKALALARMSGTRDTPLHLTVRRDRELAELRAIVQAIADERQRSRREVARIFPVSASRVIKLMQPFSALGHCRPDKFGGYKWPILELAPSRARTARNRYDEAAWVDDGAEVWECPRYP